MSDTATTFTVASLGELPDDFAIYCRECGHRLTVEKSVLAGIGPVCAAKEQVRAAA